MSNVAEIGVRVTADSSKLMSGLQSALDTVDNFGRHVEKAANKVGAIGAAITALGGKLVADASKYDGTVARSVDGLGNAYNQLATRLGRALVPAVEQLTAFVTRLVHAWDELSGPQRKAIADFAEMTAKVLMVVAVGGKVVGMVGDLAGLAATLLPLLPVLAGIAIAVVAIVAVMQALDVTWSDVWNGAKDVALQVWNWLGSTFGGVIDQIIGLIGDMIRVWADGIGKMMDAARPLLKLLHLEGVADFGKDLAGWIASLTTKSGWSDFKADGEKAIGGIVDRLKGIPEAVKQALRAAGLGALLGDGKGGKLPGLKSLADRYEVGEATQVDSGGINSMKGMEWDQGHDVLDAVQKMQEAQAQRIADLWQSMGDTFEGVVGQAFAQFVTKLTGTLSESQLKAAGQLGGMVASRSGSAGGVANSAMQGMAAGGPIGAIIGVVLDLLTRAKQFKSIIEVVDKIFSMLGDLFGRLLQPAMKVINAVMNVVSVVVDILGPLFDMLANAVGNIAPLFQLIAEILTALKPVLDIVFGAVKVITDILYLLATTVFKVLFEVLKFLANVVLTIVRGIGAVWNAILGAISGLLRWIGGLDIAGWKPFQFLSDWADTIDKGKINTGALFDAQEALNKVTWDALDAKTEEKKATNDATKAARSLAESLTNLPTGFKVAAARFDAASLGDTGSFHSASPVSGGWGNTHEATGIQPGTLSSTIGEGAPRGVAPPPITVNVDGNVYGVDDLADIIEKQQRRGRYNRTGSRNDSIYSTV